MKPWAYSDDALPRISFYQLFCVRACFLHTLPVPPPTRSFVRCVWYRRRQTHFRTLVIVSRRILVKVLDFLILGLSIFFGQLELRPAPHPPAVLRSALVSYA